MWAVSSGPACNRASKVSGRDEGLHPVPEQFAAAELCRRRKGVDELNKALYRQAPAAAPTAIAPVSYRESHREQNEEQDNDTVTTVLAAVCGVVAVVALLGSMYMLVHKYVASRADRKAQITNEM